MDLNDFSLAGKVALVTGGRRGIGKMMTLALAEAGADVAVCDIVAEDGDLSNVAAELKKNDRKCLPIQADTSRKPEVESMVKDVIKHFKRIDILVNNAGINAPKCLLDLSEEDWDRVMNVNLKGYFLCAQAAAREMIKRRQGSIINIASQLAFRTIPEESVYSITKAGVVKLTRLLARELGPYNIRTNAIAPGMVRTEFNRQNWENPAFMEKAVESVPLGRIAEVEDLKGALIYLASEASRHVNGHTLVIDGGGIA